MDLTALNARHAGDINGHLGIEMIGYGPDWLEGRMPVDARTRQPMGIRHGGASVVLAETLASAAATLDIAAAAIDRFQAHTRNRDFKTFRPEQAPSFKAKLGEQTSRSTGKPRSKAPIYSTLKAVQAFFEWPRGGKRTFLPQG